MAHTHTQKRIAFFPQRSAKLFSIIIIIHIDHESKRTTVLLQQHQMRAYGTTSQTFLLIILHVACFLLTLVDQHSKSSEE